MSREDEIRARLEAATPGPWYVPPGDGTQIWHGASLAEVERVDRGLQDGTVTEVEAESVFDQTGYLSYGDMVSEHDATFIAHAPDDLRYLLDRVATVRRLLRFEYVSRLDLHAALEGARRV